MAKSLHYLTSNIKPGAVERTLHGRRYMVADATLIVPGVLPGSRGPLYYPPEEVGKDPAVWNGMPLVLYHPTNNDGEPTSAREPDILESQGIGHVFHSVFKGRLRAKAYFDVALTENHDERLPEEHRILPRLRNGEPIEVSTGLFTRDEKVTNGSHEGKPYKAIARDYKPDHVAVLPDMRGACSLVDGCGVHNAEKKAGKGFDSDEQRRAFFGHLKGAGGKGPRSKKAGGNGGSSPSSGSDRTKQTGPVAEHGDALAAMADSGKYDNHRVFQAFEAVRAEHGAEGVRKLAEHLGVKGVKTKTAVEAQVAIKDHLTERQSKALDAIEKGTDRTKQTVPEHTPSAREEAQYKAASAVADVLETRMKAGGDVAARMEKAAQKHYERSKGFRQHFDSAEHAGRAVRAAYEAGVAVDREHKKAKHNAKELLRNAKELLRNARRKKPSSKLDMTSDKACQILKDGTVHGKPLSDAQRGMFGAKCGKGRRRKDNAFCKTGEGGGQDNSCGPEGTTGHPGIDNPLASAKTPAERVKAVYEAARHFAQLQVGDKHDSTALVQSAMTRAVAGATGKDLQEAAKSIGLMTVEKNPEKLTSAITAHVIARVGGNLRTQLISRDQRGKVRKELEQAGYKLRTNAMNGQKCQCEDCKSARRKKREKRMAANFTNNQATGNEMNKAQKVQWLTTNCDCWKDSKAQLEGFDEATLDRLITREKESQAIKANLAKPVTVGGKTYVFNAATGQLDEQQPTTPPVQSAGKKPTPEDYIAAMPDELKPVWNSMVRAHDKRKMEVVELLVNRRPEAEREAERNKLMSRRLEDVEEIAAYAGVYNARTEPDVLMPMTSYAGAGGAPVNNAAAMTVNEGDVLQLPVNNWGSDDTKPAKKQKQSA